MAEKKHTLLIDADIIAYRSCAGAEKEIEWEDDEWSITCDHKEAHAAFDEQVSHLKEQAGVDQYLLCFSDSSNFRKKVDPTYKANRASRKPVGYKAFRERLIQDNGIISICKPNIEADDCIGILATMPNRYDTVIIWSADKDLKQIPGLHLVDEGIITVSASSADEFFYRQVLTGDTADGYPGCPGIGPKKAESILTGSEGDVWPAIVAAYAKAGLTEEDAIRQARLARILRHCDWDKAKQEPILWTPPATV